MLANHVIYALVLAAVSAACTPQGSTTLPVTAEETKSAPGGAPATVDPSGSDEITSVAMVHHECFWGTCPHYVVSIEPSGDDYYIGLTVAKHKGGAHGKIPPEQFRRLTAAIYRMKFFDLNDQYKSVKDGCVVMMSDQSAVEFYVSRAGTTKHMYFYYGCEIQTLTQEVGELAKLIDDVAGDKDLLGRGEQ